MSKHPHCPWSTQEEVILLRRFNVVAWRVLRAQLYRALKAARPGRIAIHRSRDAAAKHIHKMGFSTAMPQGTVSLTTAAKRLGYSRNGLQKLLQRHAVTVKVHRNIRKRVRRGRGIRRPLVTLCVAWDEALAAVERDVTLETPSDAARRMGLDEQTVRRWVRQKPNTGRRSVQKLSPDTFNQAARAHGYVTCQESAARFRVDPSILAAVLGGEAPHRFPVHIVRAACRVARLRRKRAARCRPAAT